MQRLPRGREVSIQPHTTDRYGRTVAEVISDINIGQAMVARTMRPTLDAIAMEHHTITRLDEVEFITDRSIRQAIATQQPACLILSPLLTGGKVFK